MLALTARHVRLQLLMLAMSLALAVPITTSALVPPIGTYYALNFPAAHFPEINTAVYAEQLRGIRPALHVGAVAVRCLGGIALAAASIWATKLYLVRRRTPLPRQLRRGDWLASSKKTDEPN
ncbi:MULTISPECIES: hypothetical protein [Bradyrhizobium]|uniref:hypothetical protein n=1 Tax=Bradyrhizobium TaxID=374 RepID=UPI00293E6EDC|nr:hypothetical protein [Bradyrhizobium sp. NDS-1]WOH72754.1 hypothetical protein RX330_31495 [Bradyrhizobium sp. NDS-1]